MGPPTLFLKWLAPITRKRDGRCSAVGHCGTWGKDLIVPTLHCKEAPPKPMHRKCYPEESGGRRGTYARVEASARRTWLKRRDGNKI